MLLYQIEHARGALNDSGAKIVFLTKKLRYLVHTTSPYRVSKLKESRNGLATDDFTFKDTYPYLLIKFWRVRVMAMEDPYIVRLFYSYSHNDKLLRDELARHLGSSYMFGWHDRDIDAGMNWEREIDANLNSADIILLLISSDFMASKYCNSIEMKRALERQTADEAIVIPVIIRPVFWKNAPFRNLQVLPEGGKPVTSWANRDEAYLDIANGVHRAVNKILKKRYVAEAREYVFAGKYEDAFVAYSAALQLFPDDGILHKNIGDTLLAMQRFPEAIRAYDNAIRLRYTPYIEEEKVLKHLERFDDATTAHIRALQLAGNNFSLYKDLGNVLFRGGHFREALEAFDRVMELSSRRDAELYMRKGDALSMLESYQGALDEYENALKLAPENALLYDNKGSMLVALQRYPEAIDAYRKAIDLDNSNVEFWRNMAAALEADGRLLEACEAYEEAIKRSPRNAFLHKEKGDLLLKLDDLPGALAAYTDAIRLNNTFRFAYLSRSEVYKKMAEETYELYKRRLRLAQEDQEAAQRLDLHEENT